MFVPLSEQLQQHHSLESSADGELVLGGAVGSLENTLTRQVFLSFSSHARTRVSRWKPCSRRPPDVWPFLCVAHSPSHDKRVSTLLLRTAATKTPSWGRKMTQHCTIITVFLNDC